MTTIPCGIRSNPPATEVENSVVMVVHLDCFLQYATKYALAKLPTPRRTDCIPRKDMPRPVSMRDARARDNRADFDDVLSAAGAATAAKLFRAAKMAKSHSTKREESWKVGKAQSQWSGCPNQVRTKRDMRLAEKRRKLREKQLAIPTWDTRMTAALSR